MRVRPLTARVLLGRGLGAAPAATRFLAPRLADLRLPEGIADLPRAVERLERAVLAGERIGIFGDYDVDGVTTAAVLALALRGLGGPAHRPGRPPLLGLRLLARTGPPLLRRGLHPGADRRLRHQRSRGAGPVPGTGRGRGGDRSPPGARSGPSEAFALINPHRPDDAFSFKGLASCGVAFYLAAALRTRLRERNHPPAASFDPRGLLDLVALGTIADLVPLIEDNRILVAAGLRELTARRRPGLRVLGRDRRAGPGLDHRRHDRQFPADARG